MKFNENLKYLRKKEGLTQEELAEKLNVSRQSVTKWESGNTLPDIETVKEIAYIFSISVDTLIGDVENKTTNRLKRRINDVGWFMFAFFVVAIIINISISNFLLNVIPNIDYAIGIIILMVIITFFIIIFSIKKYFINTNEIIINMKNDNQGKKDRKMFIIKKYAFSFCSWIILSITINIDSLVDGWNVFGYNLLESLCIGIVLDIFIAIVEYKKLEKKVRDLE